MQFDVPWIWRQFDDCQQRKRHSELQNIVVMVFEVARSITKYKINFFSQDTFIYYLNFFSFCKKNHYLRENELLK